MRKVGLLLLLVFAASSVFDGRSHSVEADYAQTQGQNSELSQSTSSQILVGSVDATPCSHGKKAAAGHGTCSECTNCAFCHGFPLTLSQFLSFSFIEAELDISLATFIYESPFLVGLKRPPIA